MIDIDKLLEETADLVGEDYKFEKIKIDIDQLLDS